MENGGSLCDYCTFCINKSQTGLACIHSYHNVPVYGSGHLYLSGASISQVRSGCSLGKVHDDRMYHGVYTTLYTILHHIHDVH